MVRGNTQQVGSCAIRRTSRALTCELSRSCRQTIATGLPGILSRLCGCRCGSWGVRGVIMDSVIGEGSLGRSHQ